jgi:hypothetical protein
VHGARLQQEQGGHGGLLSCASDLRSKAVESWIPDATRVEVGPVAAIERPVRAPLSPRIDESLVTQIGAGLARRSTSLLFAVRTKKRRAFRRGGASCPKETA